MPLLHRLFISCQDFRTFCFALPVVVSVVSCLVLFCRTRTFGDMRFFDVTHPHRTRAGGIVLPKFGA